MPKDKKEDSHVSEEEDEEKQEEDPEDEDEDEEEEDEDDDEEDDDDDYSETRNKKRKHQNNKKLMQPGRKKQKTLARFFQEQAEETEDEESEEDDEFLDPNERLEAEKLKTGLNLLEERKRKVPEILKISEDALEKRYENYGDDDENIDDDEDMMPGERDEKMGQIYQQRHLPGDEDAKVFMVKCREMMERDSVLKLLNKYMYLKIHENVDLKIFSASSIEKFPGYVYIESTSEVNVRNAIKDIQGLRFGENARIKIIPKNEVPSIYSLDESKQIDVYLKFKPNLNVNFQKNLKKGQFVRMKKGLYTGDLAKIVDINVDLYEAVVKVVPRLEKIDEMRMNRENEEEKKNEGERKNKIKYSKKNIHSRPSKQLFNSNNFPLNKQHRKHELTDLDVDLNPSLSHNVFEYNGKIFLNGLLYLRTKIDNLQINNVLPTLEEMEYFIQVEPNISERGRMYDKAIEMIEETKRNINHFQKGDHVRVVDGDLTNLRGVVISTSEREVTIAPIYEELLGMDLQQMKFQTNQLVKDFKEGDHVKTQNGKTGTVLKVEDQMATILLDNYKEEVRSFVNDLMKSTEIQAEPIKPTQDFKKFDLIKLISQDSAGLVLKVDKDNVVVIDERGKVTSVSFFSIESKVNNRNVSYQNNYKHNITIDSSVKVLEGLHKGRIATVKNIFKDVLFLFDQEIRQTSGIFVEKGNNCFLINTNINNKNRVPHYQASAPSSMDQSGQAQRPRGKDSCLGQQCIIKKGGWKGFEGIIKDADDKTFRIELSAKARVLTIPRELVGFKNEVAETNELDTSTRFDQIGKTPIHRSFNPTSPYIGQSPGYPASPWQ